MISNFFAREANSTRALNACHPVKEPNTYCAGDIKYHFADFD
jgi:hypothetical protein